MKLIYCKECDDIVRLIGRTRRCKCRKSSGRYGADGLLATYSGPCVPLGIDNYSLVSAMARWQSDGVGVRLNAFTISSDCDTMIWSKKND